MPTTELERADHAQANALATTPGSARKLGKGRGDALSFAGRALEHAFFFVDRQHLERERRAQRVAGEGVAVVERRARCRRRKPSKMRRVASVAAIGSMPPVKPLAVHSRSGAMPACSRGPHRPGATVAGEHLVEHQEHVVLARQSARARARTPRRRCACPPRPAPSARARPRRWCRRLSRSIDSSTANARSKPSLAARHAQAVHEHATRTGAGTPRRPPSAVTPSVSPWKAPSSATKRVRSGRPFCAQYCSAIFSATSTAVEPLSLKKTCSKAARRELDQAASASRATGSCVMPAERRVAQPLGLSGERADQARMIVPERGAPPGRIAVEVGAAVHVEQARALARARSPAGRFRRCTPPSRVYGCQT